MLLAARLDRLARDRWVQEAILGQVWRLDARVHTVDIGEERRDDPDDPMRIAMRQMVGVFAQLDRTTTTKRLRDGRRAKAAAGGKAVGVYPYGWDRDGPVPCEQRVLVRLLDRAERGWTLQAVAAHLNERGTRTRHGRMWTTGTAHNVLARHRSRGR